MRSLLLSLGLAVLLCGPPVAAEGSGPTGDADGFGPALGDEELAGETGKFILPNGVSLALTVTSDTLVDGVAVLRTVFAVDDGAHVQVFGRDGSNPVQVARTDGAPGAAQTGVSILFDRQSGTQIVQPNFSVGGGKTVGAATDAAALGLTPLAIVAGGPAVRTPDGVVVLDQTANGAQATLTGDHLGVAHLVGGSVATAVANSADNRVIDTVTNIDIDLRDVAPFAQGTATMRVGDLALDATRGMVR